MIGVSCAKWASFSDLNLHELSSLPSPAPQQVKIAIKAAGVSYVDLLMIAGKYQWKPSLPFIPGGEVAGKVIEVGKNCRRLQIGHTVYAASTIGGYASEVLVEEEQAFLVPEVLSMAEAASSVSAFGTAYHALVDRAKLQVDERVLVLGASGGLGSASIQIAKYLGAELIAVTSSERKQAYLKQIGADQVLYATPESLADQLKALKPVHLVLDPLGGLYSEIAFRSLAAGGRHLMLGFASGQIPHLPLNLPLLKMADLRGVFWSRFRKEDPTSNRKNFGILSNLFTQQKIKPCLTKQYPLSEYKQALLQLKKKNVIGKQALII